MNPKHVTGIILAAGLGSRLLPYTAMTPKAMQDLAGQTIIRRMVAWMRYLGIERLVVVTGYLSNKLEAHLREIDPNIILVKNEGFENTQRMVSLLCAKPYIQGSFLVLDGDYFYDKKVADEIRDLPHDCITVHATPKPSSYCIQDVIVKTDLEGKLTDLSKTAGTEALHEREYYFNSMLFCPEPFVDGFLTLGEELVKDLGHGRLHIEDVVLAYANQCGPVDVCLIDEPAWVEVDTPQELEAARNFIKNNPNSTI